MLVVAWGNLFMTRYTWTLFLFFPSRGRGLSRQVPRTGLFLAANGNVMRFGLVNRGRREIRPADFGNLEVTCRSPKIVLAQFGIESHSKYRPSLDFIREASLDRPMFWNEPE